MKYKKILMIILMSIFLLVTTINANGTVLVNWSFENGTVPNAIGGWTNFGSVTSFQYYSPATNGSIMARQIVTSTTASTYKAFTSTTVNTTITFYVSRTNVSSTPMLFISDTTGGTNFYTNSHFLRCVSGTWQIYDGSANQDSGVSCLSSKTYKIQWLIHSFGATSKSDLKINNSLVLTDITDRGTVNDIARFHVGGGVNPSTTWIDNLCIETGTWVNTCFTGGVPPTSDPFNITAFSNWSSTSINNFSANINGTLYKTTNGTINTPLLQNDTNLYNISINSTEWFSQTYLNYNISSNLNVSLNQTKTNITFKFSSGDIITTPINLTSVDYGYFFNVTGGYEIINPDDGLNNFSARCDNEIFAPFNFTINLTALVNDTFIYTVNETQNVITFLDANTTNPINNSNITVYFPSGYTQNYITNSTGQISFAYIQNNSLEFGDYTYTFDKLGYVIINLTDTINISNIPHTRTYNLSRAKLNINIYDRVTRTLLTGINVSIAFIGLFNETTTTGQIVKDNLTIVGGDYLIFASAEDYKTSILSLTFTNQEEFTLNFYLLNLSSSNAGTLFVTTKDSFFRDITGAKVNLLEYIPNSLSYVNVDECISNVNAECSFAVELNTKVYYIRATSTIDNTVFIAETSRNGEIFTVNNDVRNLIFFTSTTFIISTSTNLIYQPTESFINNVSSISLDFFTTDGTAKEVCIEYFLLNNSDWISVTGDTYCLFSSNAIQNIDVDVTLNRNNTYKADIYVKESFDNILKSYSYPSVNSTGEIFDDDFKSALIMMLWVFILGFAMHQKNISLFFFLGIILSWSELLIFPTFTMVSVTVFKTIIGLICMYVARKKEDFN